MYEKSVTELEELIKVSNKKRSNVYLDTIISPSYTSAIAQIIQLPGISGMENNMAIFEFDKNDPTNLDQITDNFKLVRAGNYDVCILGSSRKTIDTSEGIHVWIQSTDAENSSLMILLSYIILSHPDWKKAQIKIFNICKSLLEEEVRENLLNLIETGRLPISSKNVEIIRLDESISSKSVVNEKSKDAGLVIIGFRAEQLKHSGRELFEGYDKPGNILFVNTSREKEIK